MNKGLVTVGVLLACGVAGTSVNYALKRRKGRVLNREALYEFEAYRKRNELMMLGYDFVNDLTDDEVIDLYARTKSQRYDKVEACSQDEDFSCVTRPIEDD